MKINLITAQTKAPQWLYEASDIYLTRLRAYCQFKVNEITPSKRLKNLKSSDLRRLDTEKLLKQVNPGDYVIACDEHEHSLTSIQLAACIEKQKDSGRGVSILIGGADGLDPKQLQRADAKWSLSQLTFPQHLARIIVIEQLYRAFTLIHNHPYHRAS